MYPDFTRILVSFIFYPEDLLHHRLRDLGHGYKSLLYLHRCGQEVPGLSLYRIRFPASECSGNHYMTVFVAFSVTNNYFISVKV